MKRILISTGGGDAPGLNAVIYAAVHAAERLGLEVYGSRDGYDGLLYPDQYPDGGIMKLDRAAVHGIAQLGGTILGTTNRGNPFQQVVRKADGGTENVDRSKDLIAKIRSLGIDVLIAIGGDGSLWIANEINKMGIRVIGVPKTIDNDLDATDLTFGFQTAVAFATECIERLVTTAASHRRILCIEVMGRSAGWIALHAGVAAMADAILIPEIPYRIECLAADLRKKLGQTQRHALVVVAEAAAPVGGEVVVKSREPGRVERFGGVGEVVAHQLQEALKVETRSVNLGHLLRGGSPVPFDRVLGLGFGAAAVQAAVEGKDGVMVALRGSRIGFEPLATAIAQLRKVPPDGMGVRVARALGISLGDDGGDI